MTLDALTFDEATHTYRVGGRVVPSVTQVIREVLAPDEYAGIPAHVLDHAAQRGRAVDRMIELDLAAELDPDSLHPELLPYWRAWQAFPERARWADSRDCATQGRIFHAGRSYAGTFDLCMPKAGMLIDIKTTARVPRTVGVQTAAYADALLIDDGALTLKRYCLHVTPTGCHLIPLTDKSDSADFLAALRIYQWRHRNDA